MGANIMIQLKTPNAFAWRGGGTGAGGTAHAGHANWYTVMTPSTAAPIGIMPAPPKPSEYALPSIVIENKLQPIYKRKRLGEQEKQTIALESIVGQLKKALDPTAARNDQLTGGQQVVGGNTQNGTYYNGYDGGNGQEPDMGGDGGGGPGLLQPSSAGSSRRSSYATASSGSSSGSDMDPDVRGEMMNQFNAFGNNNNRQNGLTITPDQEAAATSTMNGGFFNPVNPFVNGWVDTIDSIVAEQEQDAQTPGVNGPGTWPTTEPSIGAVGDTAGWGNNQAVQTRDPRRNWLGPNSNWV